MSSSPERQTQSRTWYLRSHTGILLILGLLHFLSVGFIIHWVLVYSLKSFNILQFQTAIWVWFPLLGKKHLRESDAILQRVGGNYVYHPLLSWSAKCCPFKHLPGIHSEWGWYFFQALILSYLFFLQNAALVFFNISIFLLSAWLLMTKTTKRHIQCKHLEAFWFWFWFKEYII